MKVLISTGGSGGHIFPALQTGLALKRRGHEVVFAGALSMSWQKIQSLGFDATLITAQGLTDKSIGGIWRFSTQMLHALDQSFKAVDRIKPDKVIGFGGYGSFPILMAARLKGYPTMIHEQNVVPGKANKVLAACVHKVAVSFKSSLPIFGKKAVWTGCPCNNQISTQSSEEIKIKLGLKPNARVIVLLGGSQGSKALNEAFFGAMQILLKNEDIQAVHVTGKTEAPIYQEKYKALRLPVLCSAFISPIEDVYAIADVIVSRSGAATVSELGFFGIQSILVPYPFAHGHQRYNAKVLVDAGSATLLEQKDVTVSSLTQAIEHALSKPVSRQQLRNLNADFFNDDAVEQLANAVEAL